MVIRCEWQEALQFLDFLNVELGLGFSLGRVDTGSLNLDAATIWSLSSLRT